MNDGKQIMIFDLLDGEDDIIDLFQGMTIGQITEAIAKETGLKFKPDKEDPRTYRAKYHRLEVAVNLSSYLDGHEPFIGLDYHYCKGTNGYGGGMPVDSLIAVINDIKRFMCREDARRKEEV